MSSMIRQCSLFQIRLKHTNLVKHLVALVKNKTLDASKTQLLVPDKRVKPSRCADDNVRVCLLVGEELDVLLHWRTTVEDGSLDVRHVLAESGILVLDLVGELTGVAHNQYRGLAIDWLHLLKSRKDEDCSLSETRLGLAEHIGTEDGLWNADLLDCGAKRVRFCL